MPKATAKPRSSPVRGSVDDGGSAAGLDEDVLEVLDDVVLAELTADVELLVEGEVAGAVEGLDGVELGAVG